MMTKEQYDIATQRATKDIIQALHQAIPDEHKVDVHILSRAFRALEDIGGIPDAVIDDRIETAMRERLVAVIGEVLEHTRWSSPFFFMMWLAFHEPPEDLHILDGVTSDEQEGDRLFQIIADVLVDVLVRHLMQTYGARNLLQNVRQGAHHIEEAMRQGNCVTVWDQVEKLLLVHIKQDDIVSVLQEIRQSVTKEEVLIEFPSAIRPLIQTLAEGLSVEQEVVQRRLREFTDALHADGRCSTMQSNS